MLRKAYAKINWTLDVLGKRPDGYHELDTLMQRVSLCDDIELTPADGIQILVEGNPTIPCDERNIAFRAARAYFSAAQLDANICIRVDKRIPSEAGLGGGSADAAAVLRALNDTHRALDEEKLLSLALALGADVPFCLTGDAARCKGVGERMEPLVSRSYPLVLVKPARGVSTKELFASLDLSRLPPPGTAVAKAAYEAGDIRALGASLNNALTAPAVSLLPEIGQILAELQSIGALGASMSGSGSCCFGLFGSIRDAQSAVQQLAHWPFATVCETL